MPPLFLGLDTATSYLALALWSPAEGTLAAFAERVGRDHAKRLLPELEALLGRAGGTRGDLKGIAVGTGPGSYTGLRVGAASAQGLARALGVPLVGVATLEAMAAGALLPGERGALTLDARRERVYAAAFSRDSHADSSSAEARLRSLGEVHKLERSELEARFPGLEVIHDPPPDPAYLAAQAYRRPPAPFALLYL